MNIALIEPLGIKEENIHVNSFFLIYIIIFNDN